MSHSLDPMAVSSLHSCPFSSRPNSTEGAHDTKTKANLPPTPDIPPDVLTREWFARPYEFMEECVATYGDAFTLHFEHIGTQVMISRPDHIEAVLTGDPHTLHGGKANEILGQIMGSHSPMLLDGDVHLQRRKSLLGPFQTGRISPLTSVIGEEIARVTAKWHDGEVVAIQPTMLEVSLRIILRAVFGFSDDSQMTATAKLVQRAVTLTGTQSVRLNTKRADQDSARVQELWAQELTATAAELDEMLYKHFEKRRALLVEDNQKLDILGAILNAPGENGQALNNAQLRDTLMTLFIAGHETSASSLSWAVYWLLRSPAVMQRLRTELRETPIGGEYLKAVCQETLRKNPPIAEVSRRLMQPLELPPYTLPAGISVCPSIYLLHHRTDIFESPKEFRPERFLGRKYSPYEYAPFGGGVRRCIGMHFALLEMQVVLAHLVRNFELDSVDSSGAKPIRRAVLVAPSGGGRVRVHRSAQEEEVRS